MVYRYIPILRWKRGERIGLKQVSAIGRRDVLPLFVIDNDRYREGRGGASSPAAVVVQELAAMWGTAPFYFDASALSVPAGAAHHPLVDIAAAARARGLSLIPATRPAAAAAYQSAVQSVCAIDGRGAAVRVDLQGLTSAASWVGAWPIALGQTDLIADFENGVRAIMALGASLTHAFSTLHAAGHWRSVTVAGTSLPDNFSGYTAGLHQISIELIPIWQGLNSALNYQVDYGDYATVPLNAPPSGIAWGFPINAKYTLDREFLICKGVSPTGYGGIDMDQQLIGHATSIVSYVGRNPLPHCWADTQIDDIAAGRRQPGNLESWVQIGVNRHVEISRFMLP